MQGVLFFLSVAAVIVAVLWAAAATKRRRIAEWQATAAALGLTYSEQDPFDLPSLPFELFGQGKGRTASNVLFGVRDGVETRFFDYQYYTTSSNGQTTSRQYHRFTCAVASVPFRAAHTTISRETVMSRLASMVGFHDFEFESEEFNRAYRVKGADRKFASYLIDTGMMEWLMPVQGCSFELRDEVMLAHTSQISPAKLSGLVTCLDGFRANIPAVVTQVYGKKA